MLQKNKKKGPTHPHPSSEKMAGQKELQAGAGNAGPGCVWQDQKSESAI